MTDSQPGCKAELRELESILAETAFTRHYGFRLTSVAYGSCALLVPFQELFERPGGIVSGQVYMAAADVAAWLAIKTIFGPDDASVTISQNTQFLSSVRNAPFHCVASVERAGDKLVFLTAECKSESGKLVALHSLTYLGSRGGPA